MDAERTLRVVVLDGRGSRRDGLSDSIATAFVDSTTVSTAPSNPPPQLEEEEADTRIHQADAAIALDGSSLERAREAGVPLCVAVLPSFDIAWAGDVTRADKVFVAHEALARALADRGVPSALIETVGPIAPSGFTPAADRATVLSSLGLADDARRVLVPASVVDELGTTALLVQLASVRGAITWMFDVGNDPEVADSLRRSAPLHGIRGFIFSQGSIQLPCWQVADLVLSRSRGEEVSRALAVHCPLVILPPGRTDAVAAAALEAAGVALAADATATLAVTVEEMIDGDRLSVARRAVVQLDAPANARRLAARVRDVWSERREDGTLLPRGLPFGLEPLPTSVRETRPSGMRSPVDHDVEAELEALKKRL